MNHLPKGTAVITGATSGIGAIYADRLAKRGHDLILVARDRERLFSLAQRLKKSTGRSVEVFAADLNNKHDLERVETELRDNQDVSMLVNGAGLSAVTPLLDSDANTMGQMIDLNINALMRLTYAVVPSMVKRERGTIINLASIAGIAPEILNGVFGGTKAFVFAFSLSLDKELAAKNIRIQVVLPGVIAAGALAKGGSSADEHHKDMMSVEDLVDAAIVGLDQGELITIPSLPDILDWEAYEDARQNMMPKLLRNAPAPRYLVSGHGERVEA
jgi:uncharacterized protein